MTPPASAPTTPDEDAGGDAGAPGGRPYFPQLDGVRAIAAMMVMAFHFSQSLYGSYLLILGQTGVDLFFVLSGFLISTILLQAPHGDWREIGKFYIRRVLRIFPLYYGYLLVASILGAGVSWWFWVYLQNFPMAVNHPGLHGPDHFWSLAVEEQFYLVWPFLVLFWPRCWLAQAMWGTIAASTMLRVLIAHTQVSPFYLTFTRLDGLAAGGLLALYLRRGTLARARGWLAAGVPVFLVLLAAGARLSAGHGLAWVQVTKFSAATGVYACGVGLLLTAGSSRVLGAANGLLSSRPMRAVGRVSYGLYVFHPPILGLIVTYLGDWRLGYKLAAFCVLTYGVSLASFYGFERRFTDMKQRLAPERPFGPTRISGERTQTGFPDGVKAENADSLRE